ncbi:hypothetical protein [Skermania piniformis]|uniref:Uncharacterized protein n=1 Tax=Skermania pinensis TaxID=39122 RepID=A0ABX8S9J4_9ACTN|nr:hypothetical protein [Skermania piniformis]QXQ14443.1 hypothetical protein KV203_03225 [Skermania piniformis]
MTELHKATGIFEANARALRSAEQKAGTAWRDVVSKRLKDRKLQPLADEERSFLQALARYDVGIAQALRELDKHR